MGQGSAAASDLADDLPGRLVCQDAPDVQPSFRYWEDGVWNGVTYGPSIASPGMVATDFQSGPILPELGGYTHRGQEGLTLHFPIACLRLPEGGIANVERQQPVPGRALMVFTDDALLERFIHGRLRGGAAILLEDVVALDDLIDALEILVEVVLIDPHADTLAPRNVLTVEQIRVRRIERDGSANG